MDSPRSSEAFDSPRTQRTASMMLDLPQPLGPTTPTSCPGRATAVGSTKDLKPASLSLVRRIGSGSRGHPAAFPARPSGGPYNSIRAIQSRYRSMSSQPSKQLETFPNPAADRDFHIHMEIPEFTCLCPKTGQPDFAVLYLDYIPDQLC